MTTWTIVEEDPDYTVSISDEARKRLSEEQNLTRVDRIYTEIRLGALGGALLTIAGLVVVKLFGG